MMSKYDWSTTAADNDDADSTINWRENQAPSTVNNSARAMMAAEAVWLADTHRAITTGGSSNAYTVTSNGPLTVSIPDGFRIYCLPNHTNTGASTLNVDSLGAKNLRITSGTSLSAGDIVVNRPFIATFRNASDEFLIDSGALDTQQVTSIAESVFATGSIIAWPTATPATGFLECDGSAVSRTTYADLFAVISDDYGNGDGSTTFNLPDYRGEFLRGYDNSASNDPNAGSRTDRGDGTTGDAVGTKQEDATDVNGLSATTTATTNTISPQPNTGGAHDLSRGPASSTVTLSSTDAETRPRNVSVMWCIKY
jgi:microcystin-dependent protein